jgi:D-3-phosphoglycerate dehydrogenase
MAIPVILSTTSSFSYNKNEVIQNPHKRKLTEEELIELLDKFKPEILIAGVEPVTERAMKIAPNLKVISRVGVGLDNVDLTAAQKNNIKVFNTPDAVTAPVAELTIGLMLSILRNIHQSHLSVINNNWERPMGALLKDKIVGIMGAGRIGMYVANLLNAFGARVLFYDPFINKSSIILENNLNDFASRIDILTIHMPVTKENEGFLNCQFISSLKEGCLLINTSRGELVNEDDLFKALAEGKIAAAALDVFSSEPYVGKLTQLKNVLFTAHIGSYAKEARDAMEKQAYDNAIKFLKNV